VQFKCVHTAENARRSPAAVRTRMPGRLPNLKICPVFGFTSSGLRAMVTEAAVDSPAGGGTRYRLTG